MCECSFFCEITVEHSASVLIRALHGGLDMALRKGLSPVFHRAYIGTHHRLYFFDHGLFPLQKYSSFLLKYIQATD